MAANKKRRKLPEEDLAAAVADIINSPITRSNLSFLRPLGTPAPTEGEQPIPKPMGLEITPMGVKPTPMGHQPKPMGDESAESAGETLAPVSDGLPASDILPIIPASDTLQIPVGFEPSPMGFELTPPGLPDAGAPSQPPLSFRGPPTVPSPVRPPADSQDQAHHPHQPWQPPSGARTLWQAEGYGTFIEQSRVRRIYQAQDALSLVEEKVYDLLWGTKNQRKDDFRLVHYSLQRIASEARINIKTVRELIPRLIEKGFIHVEHEADARRNIPTLYRVSSYAAVLSHQKQRGRLYVAKTGKGVVYVHSVSAVLATSDAPDPTSRPMGFEPTPMGVRPIGLDSKPTGVTPTGPLGLEVSKPMGSAGTVSLGSYTDSKNRQTTTSPAAFAALVRSIHDALGAEPDHALLTGIIEACHQNAILTTGEPASEEELLYFTGSKARVIFRAPNIRNHLAVLRKAVPECFLGESFRAYRAAAALRKQKLTEDEQRTDAERAQRQREAAEAEARYALWARISETHKDERGYDLQAIAADPDLDDLGRQQAKRLMDRLGRYTRSGL
jgi:predicted transcriptional regulator